MAMMAKARKLLSVPEAALRLGLSEVWVRRLISEGRIATVRQDWRVFVAEDSLESFVRTRQVRQAIAKDDGRWATEEKVVDAVERHLKKHGWKRVSRANTRSRERGVDLVMARSTERLAIEAKGFPGLENTTGPNAGRQKFYAPTQARNYMGGLLLSVLLLLEDQPDYFVAVAVPDRTTFTTLLRRLTPVLRRLGIGAYVVEPTGEVTEHLLPRRRGNRPDTSE